MNNFWIQNILFIAFFSICSHWSYAQSGTGTIERIRLHSQALEGNLIGDSADRHVSIYLPPGYYQNPEARYPVIYFLHGFTDSDELWFGFKEHWIHLPKVLDQAIEEGTSSEMIVVMPNAYNRFKGSMYSNSVTIGDWETFIAKELPDYIDRHYRTFSKSTARGLAGHSMGGYGTMRIGMKYPDVFSSLYLLSPCCMANNVNPNPGLIKNIEKVKSIDELEQQPFFVIATLATAAAWSPNPLNPPFYLDLPYKDGKIDPDIRARFDANSTLTVIHQHISNIKQLNAIALDVGKQDWGIAPNSRALDSILNQYEIPHFFEEYEGDHVNRIAERIRTKVLPYFSEKLKAD
jgi:enterochelin esterase-like enzyme